MGKGIYVATSGSLAQLRHMEMLSNNLANARTTGFKADRLTFEETLAQNVDNPVGPSPGGPSGVEPRTGVEERNKHYVQPRGAPVDMSPGAYVQTDNPLDVAVSGNGMLLIETTRGTRMTKGGPLVIGRDGTLMTNNGHPVLSNKGKHIVLPPDRVPMIDADGLVHTDDGEIAQLAIATPDLSKGLQKDPDGYFARLPDAAPTADVQVLQGHLEESNASPVRTMLELIDVQRTFSALRQVISASAEMDTQAARLAR